MPDNKRKKIRDLLLEAHARGVELAIDTSIRTGVPLVVEKEGKIFEIEPQYKYIRVPIKSAKAKPKTSSKRKLKN